MKAGCWEQLTFLCINVGVLIESLMKHYLLLLHFCSWSVRPPNTKAPFSGPGVSFYKEQGTTQLPKPKEIVRGLCDSKLIWPPLHSWSSLKDSPLWRRDPPLWRRDPHSEGGIPTLKEGSHTLKEGSTLWRRDPHSEGVGSHKHTVKPHLQLN